MQWDEFSGKPPSAVRVVTTIGHKAHQPFVTPGAMFGSSIINPELCVLGGSCRCHCLHSAVSTQAATSVCLLLAKAMMLSWNQLCISVRVLSFRKKHGGQGAGKVI